MSKKIMIVDDNPSIIFSVKEGLELIRLLTDSVSLKEEDAGYFAEYEKVFRNKVE